MRYIIAMFIVIFLLCPVASPATAQDQTSTASEETPVSPDPKTFDRIVIDQEPHAIRFIIEGREVARLDATGLRVRGDIGYGGTVTDFGAYYNRSADTAEGRDDR